MFYDVGTRVHVYETRVLPYEIRWTIRRGEPRDTYTLLWVTTLGVLTYTLIFHVIWIQQHVRSFRIHDPLVYRWNYRDTRYICDPILRIYHDEPSTITRLNPWCTNVHLDLSCSLHSHTMTNNPYINHICEMTGESPRQVVLSMSPPLRPMTFPCTIHGRTFETQDDYLNEMYEFLNGL